MHSFARLHNLYSVDKLVHCHLWQNVSPKASPACRPLEMFFGKSFFGVAAVTKWPWDACVQGAAKLKVAIVGGGLAGLSTAVELLDQGYDVEIYEQRPFIGGKVCCIRSDAAVVHTVWCCRHVHGVMSHSCTRCDFAAMHTL
jgi:hypothetical protein